MFERLITVLTRSPDEVPPGPNRMDGNEPLLGYIAAGLIGVGAILNLVITTGNGAPAHPTTWTSFIGLVLAAALALTLRVRNRLLSPFLAIFGAFFVTLERGPNSLEIPHIAVLIVAVAFAVIVSLHQRRDQRLANPAPTAAERREAADARRRRRRGEPEPASPVKRPPASKRYTPPKNAAKK